MKTGTTLKRAVIGVDGYYGIYQQLKQVGMI
jgi:hypothetical protein